MTYSVWVVIPYNADPQARLNTTQNSVRLTDAAGHCLSNDRYGGSLPKTINEGVEMAKRQDATHICWLSTGDTLHPDRFKHALPTDKGQCCLVNVETRGTVIPQLQEGWQERIYRDNQFCGSGMVVPVHVWDAVGGFNEELTYCSDWDFAIRVQHQFGWECVPEVLAYAHEYPDGLTKSANQAVRNRDRAKVARMANRLRKGGKA